MKTSRYYDTTAAIRDVLEESGLDLVDMVIVLYSMITTLIILHPALKEVKKSLDEAPVPEISIERPYDA